MRTCGLRREFKTDPRELAEKEKTLKNEKRNREDIWKPR
jgi:hypothetical protein